MSTTTKNYKFIKPDLTDPADIRVINENFDKLDEMIYASGEVGKHIADPNAHSDLFAKYLPLEGGTLTGSVYGKYSEWSANVKFGGNLILGDDKTTTIGNGYSKRYGAKITCYGNDITTGYTSRKNNVWIESIDSADSTNKYSRIYLTPDMVTISTGSNRTSKYALYTPSIGTSTIYAQNNNLDFVKSLNENCSIRFMDTNSNQYIRFMVNDNQVDIRSDGVYYNDNPSVMIVERAGDVNAWYVKYNDGTMLQGGIITADSERLTFPQPFKDTNYCIMSGALTSTDASIGGCALFVDDKQTTSVALFNSCSNSGNRFTGWYRWANNDARKLMPHWIARGDWK